MTLTELKKLAEQAKAAGLARSYLPTDIVLVLLATVQSMQKIRAFKGKTQLADCCVVRQCHEHVEEGKITGECTWRVGVARGFNECAGEAEDALTALKEAGVEIE